MTMQIIQFFIITIIIIITLRPDADYIFLIMIQSVPYAQSPALMYSNKILV